MHHATLVIGDCTASRARLEMEHKDFGPDVVSYSFNRLGIDDARHLKEATSSRPVIHGLRIFIVHINTATIEAQNALLKLFEEPQLTTRFYVVVPRRDTFIPTLLSRFMIEEAEFVAAELPIAVTTFLSLSQADRLEEIKTRTKNKDMVWIEELLSGLEIWATEKQKTAALREILFVRMHERQRSASHKMLLEHLSLSLV